MRFLVRRLLEVGVPKPELEYQVFDGGRLVAVLDGYLRDAYLGLEVDDWLTHGSRAAADRDRQRHARLLSRCGITTIRTSPRALRKDPTLVVETFKKAYERALGTRARSTGRAAPPQARR